MVLVALVDLGQDVADKLKGFGRIEIANLFFTAALTLVVHASKRIPCQLVQST